MEIPKTYSPTAVEEKWYRAWLDNNCFKSVPDDREPFTIVIPPPNVTGVLHMGHMLNNSIQDVLIRRARMQGKNACWVPGTDHASIATEAKVVRMLREQGIKKGDLSREDFLKYAWEWKEKYGGIILEQLKKLGASCDWDRTHFTMDADYYDSVINVFIDLFNKGFIYRDLKMVNWDCEALTTVSNEEVIYNEDGEKAWMYSVQYAIENSNETITIATQRPETIMGDTAIAVNPKDERYLHLIGKFALVPMINRRIPIIADDYVDVAFGTGCLKVTPAHDINDYEIGQRHQLPIIDTLNSDGTLNEKCEMPEMVGIERFEARKIIVKKLQEVGILVDKKEVVSRIGRSERTNSVIEPRLSKQWFIKMKEISQPALLAVENDEVVLHPAKFKNTYRYWMENVRDWCISRQLWWGHRIPAWYLANQNDIFVVAKTETEALELFKSKGHDVSSKDIKQDDDVLDTWASSWLWPMAVFQKMDGFDTETGKLKSVNPELAYYYPTNTLVTAPEILFFWVARMIIAGYEYLGEKPFKDVYLTGIVRDKLGRKMSKSLGNSPDPLDLIEKFGADGVRVGMLLTSPAGNDLPFDESLCEQGRNFSNKIWNAFRLITSWTIDNQIEQPQYAKEACAWFDAKLNQTKTEIEDLFSKYRISEALMATYKLVWDDFCAWYLELIKPVYGQPIDAKTHRQTIVFFEELLQWMHPFTPFITEEIWSYLSNNQKGFIMLSQQKPAKNYDLELIKRFENTCEWVSAIRNFRQDKSISPKLTLDVSLIAKANENPIFESSFIKLSNIGSLKSITEKPAQSLAIIVRSSELFIQLPEQIDLKAETEKLQKELDYTLGFLDSVKKKLSNEKFVQNAKPEIIENEKKKLNDAEMRIDALQKQLLSLS